ncbi:MAG: nucleotidyltransferase family protein [Kiritimatiellae bacterium]|nr:nucleotidyltransferase family protein [Kiritimatiellia bacterium]
MSSAHTPTLLKLLRAAVSGGTAAWPETRDWPGVYAAALRHGVAPFLYATVAPAERAEARPPEELLARWRALHLAVLARQMRIERQAAIVLRAFAGAGVRALPLKGLWLASHVYPSPGQRPMCDMDWLVQPERFAPAAQALQELGYTAAEALTRTDYNYDVTFRHPQGDCQVELHWQMGSRTQELGPLPGLDTLWQRTERGALGGEACECISPEEHLALLIYHLVHHRFSLSLRAWLDLALLLRHIAARGLHVGAYREAVEHWNLRRAAPLLLLTTADLLGAGLTDALAAVLPVGDWGRTQRDALAEFALSDPEQDGAVPAEGTWVEFRRRGPFARMRLLWRRIWMPREFMRRQYPEATTTAGLLRAYLERSWGLVIRNGGMLWRLLRGETTLKRRLSQSARRLALARWALGSD